jgi:FHA domain
MPRDEKSSNIGPDAGKLLPINRAAVAMTSRTAPDTDPQFMTCPQCGRGCRLADTACPQCGAVFDDLFEVEEGETTFALASQLPRRSPGNQSWPKVGAIPIESVTVVFEFEDESLTLPYAESAIVGRAGSADGAEVYVDLGPLCARETGVSRRHVKILRKGTLIYVVDVGSTNGTWLNGRRLMVNVERLLRNGDELQLGSLKLHVKYS